MTSNAEEGMSQLATFKETLEKLRKEYGAANNLHAALFLTQQAVELCRAVVAAIPTRQVQEAGVTIPVQDDGVTAILRGLPVAWGIPRVAAYVERFGQPPSQVAKADNSNWAVLVFDSTDSRAAFVTNRDASLAASKAADKFTVEFPGSSQQHSAAGGKRSAAEAGVSAGRGPAAAGGVGPGGWQKKQRRTDVREAVCPLWQVPYKDQLARKVATLAEHLKDAAKQLRQRCGRGGEPSWLRDSQLLAPIQGILRSPQLEGYRNKAEFTVGYNEEGQPTVGFLLGSYVEGLTHVCDPRECRHIAKPALALAASMQQLLRSGRTKLPAWDKTQVKGFWRLLVVRESREVTFLPVPQYAGGKAAAAAAGGVLTGVDLAGLPLEPYLVAPPVPAAAGAGAGGAAAATGYSLSTVEEQEAPTPPASQLLVMAQVSPAAFSKEEVAAEVKVWGEWMAEQAAAQGLPAPVLVVQVHDGVANAASADAPLMSWQVAVDTSCTGAQPAVEAGTITEALCQLRFRVSSTAFFQVNTAATCVLYHLVGEWAAPEPNTLLLDVCCGTGTIGISMAGRVKRVIGIDNVAEAIADAEANAALNGATNCTYVCSPAEAVLDRILQDAAGQFTHVTAVVDPPRGGLHKLVVRALLGCAAVKRLVYVSCNPVSLVSNLVALCQPWTAQAALQNTGHRQGQGRRQRQQDSKEQLAPLPEYAPFQPVKALACDLFPHTSHVESVILLERSAT